MFEPCKNDRCLVENNGQKFEATLSHVLFADVLGEDGKPVEGKRGAMLGIGVRTDKGHVLYVQQGAISPLEGQEEAIA